MTRVLVVFEEIPENIHFSVIEATPEDLAALEELSGKYVNCDDFSDKTMQHLYGPKLFDEDNLFFMGKLKKNRITPPVELGEDVKLYNFGFAL